ncbi:transglycosylase domain-containing protein [Marinobacter sp.]|uniref:transglycosylase domain-containing protein n=1 Tax=Marinobacter sp. TaxID=50741 RepID=UPI0035673CCC
MAKNTILRVFIALLTTPYVAASRLACKFGHEAFKADIERCSKAMEVISDRAKYLYPALVIAEDHRNNLHLGIDPLGIISASLGTLFRGKRRGASTIEQQFVRVVTARYERSVRRKVREQLIAIEICRRHDKSKIAEAYLSRAFFGSQQEGAEQLEKSCSTSFEDMSLSHLILLTAQLKYPKPLIVNGEWQQKVNDRWIHLHQVRRFEIGAMNGNATAQRLYHSAHITEQVELRNRI